MDKIPESSVEAAEAVGILGHAVVRNTDRFNALDYAVNNHIDTQRVMEDVIYSMSMAAFQAAKDQESAFGDVAKAALAAAAKIVMALAAETIASAVASAMEAIPFPWNLIAAVGAGVAAAAIVSSAVPSFAEGGMVTGPTLALVGDNPSGRELIVPWEKLGQLTGAGDVEVSGLLVGENIHLSNTRYMDKLKRTGRIR